MVCFSVVPGPLGSRHDIPTHSLFEESEFNIVLPVGLRGVGELYEAYEAGQALLVSDRCQ